MDGILKVLRLQRLRGIHERTWTQIEKRQRKQKQESERIALTHLPQDATKIQQPKSQPIQEQYFAR